MKRLTTTLLLCCVATSLLSPGCGTLKKEKKTQALDAAARAYGKSIRWAYYEAAYGYVHPDQREEIPEHLENVRVTSYEVVQPLVMKSDERAEQVVAIEYVLRDQQVLYKLSERQDWRYEEKEQTWWLHSDLPRFKGQDR